MAARLMPSDQPARQRIANDLATTLFVEAGAGSGKTRALVDRVVSLMATGTARIDEIAAITFTEKAAAELRDRIRAALVEAGNSDDDVVAARCSKAAADVDGAAIQTLHAFAQRLLLEYPLAAGLPPGFVVLEEIASAVAFSARWRVFRDDLFERPDTAEAILRLLALGQRIEYLADLAHVLGDNWDRLADLERWPVVPLAPIDLSGIASAGVEVRQLQLECRNPDDRLLERIRQKVDPWLAEVFNATSESEVIRALQVPLPGVGNVGTKANWPDVEGARATVAALEAERLRVVQEAADGTIDVLGRYVGLFTIAAAQDRIAQGVLEFHDLLVVARGLLRHNSHARASLAARYRYLLLDEFQDTDPIQYELADLLRSEGSQLFFVGDPKQSIYRFRRADIELFRRVKHANAAGLTQLTTNFRARPEILGFLNALFEPQFVEGPGQAGYVRLEQHRSAMSTGGPAVVLVGEPHSTQEKLNAESLRTLDAVELVATISQALGEGWLVQSPDGAFRPARAADIAILLPARTSLPMLEAALEDAGIAYRAETSSLVYATQEVRDLLMVLRSVSDPTDELAVVAALRSPVFGCGDDDLYRYHEAGGRWDFRGDPPAVLAQPNPVADAMADLRRWFDRRWWQGPAALLQQVIADRDLLSLGLADRRPRDLWRRLRFVVDQARAFTENVGGDLRSYLDWARAQGAEGSRVSEPVLAEPDDDAVRVLTVHGSKGLEFPIVAVAGLSTLASAARRGVRVLWHAEGERPEIRLGKGAATIEFDDLKPLEEQLDAKEKLRLLYVALTRARDHLIVGTHHVTRPLATASHAQLLWEWAQAFPQMWEPSSSHVERGVTVERSVASPHGGLPSRPAIGAEPDEPLDRAEWERHRRLVVSAAVRPAAVAATGLAAQSNSAAQTSSSLPSSAQGEALSYPPSDDTPWRRGRAGTAVGRAVHGALQVLDFDMQRNMNPEVGESSLRNLAQSHASAEGVGSAAADVERMLRVALGSAPIAAAVAAKRHWRELYVAAQIAGTLVEGYVDLLYEDAAGLHLVDYKTDAAVGLAAVSAAVERYRLQGGAYAAVLMAITGRPVHSCTFLFLSPTGAVSREIDIAQAAADVEALLRPTPAQGTVPLAVQGEQLALFDVPSPGPSRPRRPSQPGRHRA